MNDDLVGRLLGPGGQPLSCEQCFEELDRYVEWMLSEPDGPFESCAVCERPHECSGAYECLAMSAHLAACPACDEEYESLCELVLAEQAG